MPEPQSPYDEAAPGFALTPPPDASRTAAYVAATDGRLVRLAHLDGLIEITIAGRHPLTLDRYQAAALQAVLDDMITGAR